MEVRVLSQGGDTIHRLPVGRDDSLGLLRRLWRVASGEDLKRGFDAGAVALDRRGSHGRLRSREAPQGAGPGLGRFPQVPSKVAAKLVELGQPAFESS